MRHRGIVLKLHHAAALHRWMELLMDGRKFDNPIVLAEVKENAIEAKHELGQKLIAMFEGGP